MFPVRRAILVALISLLPFAFTGMDAQKAAHVQETTAVADPGADSLAQANHHCLGGVAGTCEFAVYQDVAMILGQGVRARRHLWNVGRHQVDLTSGGPAPPVPIG